MTKKELIEKLEPLRDDASVLVYAYDDSTDRSGYAKEMWVDEVVSGDNVHNEITLAVKLLL